MSGTDIARLQDRLETSLTILRPEDNLALPSELLDIYELVIDMTNDGLEECRLSLEDELKANRKEAA